MLEIGGEAYTKKFGADRVGRNDIAGMYEGQSAANIMINLTNAGHITCGPCLNGVILARTLPFISDVQAVLATLPGISQIGDSRFLFDSL